VLFFDLPSAPRVCSSAKWRQLHPRLGSIGLTIGENTAVLVLFFMDGWLQQPNGRNVLRFHS